MKRENIEQRKARLKKEAVQGVLLFAVVLAATAACFGVVCFVPDTPKAIVVVFGILAVLCLVPLIPALVVLKGRFAEIEGGELDEASKY